MRVEIQMPKLGYDMASGRIVAWRIAVGDRVERGATIADVETDKVTVEIETFAAGLVVELRAEPDEVVPVGTVIAVLDVDA